MLDFLWIPALIIFLIGGYKLRAPLVDKSQRLKSLTVIILLSAGFTFYCYVKLTYRQQTLFEKQLHNNKIVVMAIYETTIRADVLELFKIFKKHNYDILAINNAELDATSIAKIADVVDIYIERDNIGYDFGSYKIAYFKLLNEKKFDHLQKAIFCNDSVYYIAERFDPFLKNIDTIQEDWIGIIAHKHESFLGRYYADYHVSSWFQVFSNKILKHAALYRFFDNYDLHSIFNLNGDIKYYAIYEGEYALTGRLVRANFRPHILYNDMEFCNSQQLIDLSLLAKGSTDLCHVEHYNDLNLIRLEYSDFPFIKKALISQKHFQLEELHYLKKYENSKLKLDFFDEQEK